MGRLRDRFYIAEGRKSVRRRVTRAAHVSRKAARAGLVVGTMAAAAVVTREIRKHRRGS